MIEILRRRRSIRSYTGDPLDADTISLLMEALLRAPSSRDLQPWQFVLVDDPQLLAQLAEAKEHGSSFLKGAPLAVVILADPERCDVWIEDCSIAAILLQLEAESLGLGSCWVQIRLRTQGEEASSEEYVRGVLGIPQELRVASVIGIGHPRELKTPVPAERLQYQKIRYNDYRKYWR